MSENTKQYARIAFEESAANRFRALSAVQPKGWTHSTLLIYLVDLHEKYMSGQLVEKQSTRK